jgi:hypothetical protein
VGRAARRCPIGAGEAPLEPRRQSRGKARVTGQDELASIARRAHAHQAQSDGGHDPNVGHDVQIDVEDALSAAPHNLVDTVTVKDLEGNVLRAGTGNYACYPAPEGIAGPMCGDDEWHRWMAAWMAQEPFTPSRLAIACLIAGDSADGGASNINPFDSEPAADNDWIVEGPHVMIIVPDQSVLEGLPITRDTDEPYVMWSGTDYAHIMLPVDVRPEQRPLPTQ